MTEWRARSEDSIPLKIKIQKKSSHKLLINYDNANNNERLRCLELDFNSHLKVELTNQRHYQFKCTIYFYDDRRDLSEITTGKGVETRENNLKNCDPPERPSMKYRDPHHDRGQKIHDPSHFLLRKITHIFTIINAISFRIMRA